MEDTDVEDTPKPKRKVNYAIQPESEDEDSQIGIEGGKYVTPKAFQKKASNFQPASKSDSPEITDFVIDRDWKSESELTSESNGGSDIYEKPKKGKKGKLDSEQRQQHTRVQAQGH
jgi:hypothetical protein